ncbi:response regulator [Lutibaculum baratangense]|uniref:Transcriptional regulator FixK n=1 Tax=Lutibaculum baratangense AMV1 TaxID=631454 RepID=V4R3D7_9HYPH|nr:response regulator [Lutibaculum baratangense]ESR26432.1 transcriptional regulator FixK [Lutibaculum baratangense AMV1]
MPRFYIVEDDSAVGDSLAVFLSSHGHDAVRYGDAESFFREVVPVAGDTLIVDIGLPGMSGSQLIRWVSKLRDEPSIIVISGKSELNLRSELEGLPVKRLIRKPFDASAVEALL